MNSIKKTFITLCVALAAISGFAQNATEWKNWKSQSTLS